jgi:hypothetical protein
MDDHLYRGERIQAIAATQDEFGLALQESLAAVHGRWAGLKSEFPGRFLVTVDGYWNGVYT